MANPSNWNKLDGKGVPVIGGSSGVGYEVAEGALAYEASCVTITSEGTERNQEAQKKLAAFAGDSGNRVIGITCDLGDQAKLESGLIGLLERATDLFTVLIDYIVFIAGDNHKPRPPKEVTTDSSIDSGRFRFFAPLILGKVIAKLYMDGKQSLRESCEPSFLISNGYTSQFPINDWSQ